MTDAQLTRDTTDGHGNRWLSAAFSLAIGGSFFALWFWLLPRWLGFSVEMAGAARWRWLAAVPSVLGFAVALRCVDVYKRQIRIRSCGPTASSNSAA